MAVAVRDKMLTREEVAEMLNVPAASLASWAYQGRGPRYFKVGKHARYRLADVEQWLTERASQ